MTIKQLIFSIDEIRFVGHAAELGRESFLICDDTDVLIVRGWAFSEDLQEAPNVVARVGGFELQAPRNFREDVAATYGGNATHCGFASVVSIGAIAQLDLGAFLEIELAAKFSSGLEIAFDTRKILIVDSADVDRSDTLQVDAVVESETGPQILGWGFGQDPSGARLGAAAIFVDGKFGFQVPYGRSRADVFERVGLGPDVGFSCCFPEFEIEAGDHELRLRLYGVDGYGIESASSITMTCPMLELTTLE
jgi:hypothetical protein